MEELLISNDDLTIECRQLKEKLSESEGSLAIIEEQMESLRAGKLRETEKSNSLACELALSQVRSRYFWQDNFKLFYFC